MGQVSSGSEAIPDVAILIGVIFAVAIAALIQYHRRHQ